MVFVTSTIKSSEMVVSAKRAFAVFFVPPHWGSVVITAVGSYLLTLPQSYALLLSTMVASLLSNFFVSVKLKQVSAWAGFFSVVRRLFEIYLLYMTHLVFDAISDHFGMPMDMAPLLALAFTGVEFVNFTEDCKTLGVPLPGFYADRLKKLREVIGQTGDVVMQQQTTKLSPAGVVMGSESTITTVTLSDQKATAPLIVPSTDINKPDKN